jgi:uncharacterized HhH-GPD family protein
VGVVTALNITGDPQADALLDADPFALLTGMMLDQQIPMEKAFGGPRVLATRLGLDRLDPARIASMDPGAFAAAMAGPPAVHRYHSSMAARVQALAGHVEQQYAGDAAAIWTGVGSGQELLARLRRLPGFGDQKARIFLALLGKQRGVTPAGWQQAAGDYGTPGRRSVADAGSLSEVREYKRAVKAAGRAAEDPRPVSGSSGRGGSRSMQE